LFKPLNVFGCSIAVVGEVKVIDRASIGVIRCSIEGGRAYIVFKKGLNARSVQTGYGRLFFRQGRGWSAGLKHLYIESKSPAGLSISMSLREVVGLVKNFYGVVCAPMAKIDIPHGKDVWLIMLASIYNTPLLEISKPILTADRVSVQASLSGGDGGLRYSLTAYGSGFRRAGLELTRQVYTGLSTAFGREKITASEKLAEAWPGENIQSVWKPVKRHIEPTIIAMNSIPSRNDVVTLLQSLGCIIHNVLLLGPRILHSPFIVGDGEAVTYRVRLKLDGKTIDEIELKISFS
jgi:hypothetical protein